LYGNKVYQGEFFVWWKRSNKKTFGHASLCKQLNPIARTRRAALKKVFWFFSSEKNMLPFCLIFPKPE
jgi:hypothetical protein